MPLNRTFGHNPHKVISVPLRISDVMLKPCRRIRKINLGFNFYTLDCLQQHKCQVSQFPSKFASCEKTKQTLLSQQSILQSQSFNVRSYRTLCYFCGMQITLQLKESFWEYKITF